MKKTTIRRCYGCGRHALDCWTMPCLVLDYALASGDSAVKSWGKRSGGLKIVRRTNR